MCWNCGPLIKAIDAYIQKADGGLSEELGAQGYVKPKKTVKYVSELEDGVAEALLEETDYILAGAMRQKRPLTSKPLRRTFGRK